LLVLPGLQGIGLVPQLRREVGAECFGRLRDLLPLPRVVSLKPWSGIVFAYTESDVLDILNGVILGFSALYSKRGFAQVEHLCAAQADVVRIVLGKLARLIGPVFESSSNFLDEAAAFLKFTGQLDSGVAGTLVADRFDFLGSSGEVNPLTFVPKPYRSVVAEPSLLFKGAHCGVASFSGIQRQHRKEYAELVGRKIVCGKVQLQSFVADGASIIAVGKMESKKLREVRKYGTADVSLPLLSHHLSRLISRALLACSISRVFLCIRCFLPTAMVDVFSTNSVCRQLSALGSEGLPHLSKSFWGPG